MISSASHALRMSSMMTWICSSVNRVTRKQSTINIMCISWSSEILPHYIYYTQDLAQYWIRNSVQHTVMNSHYILLDFSYTPQLMISLWPRLWAKPSWLVSENYSDSRSQSLGDSLFPMTPQHCGYELLCCCVFRLQLTHLIVRLAGNIQRITMGKLRKITSYLFLKISGSYCHVETPSITEQTVFYHVTSHNM